jgi:hypothetical protein
MTGMVGSVTRQRYDELVELGRGWVAEMSAVQWRLGDAAGEIEPMRAHGGTNPPGSEELFTVSEALRMFAEDVGLAYTTVGDYRWVASRWPKEHRRADVSHTIHKILASIPDAVRGGRQPSGSSARGACAVDARQREADRGLEGRHLRERPGEGGRDP